MQAKFPIAPLPPPEIFTPLNRKEVGVEDKDAYKNKEAKSSTKGDGKGEYHHMPWYSPLLWESINNILMTRLSVYQHSLSNIIVYPQCALTYHLTENLVTLNFWA
jgi:hypothetical protein